MTEIEGENTPSRDQLIGPALEPEVITARMDLAHFTASIFKDAGEHLHIIGHFLGTDQREGLSPFGHGNDETVAISMLLNISSQLVSASADLIEDGHHYAGCALIRQLVEVEYLAWAFEAKDQEAAKWMRSTHEERKSFFAPAKLRSAAGKHFRSVDYGYHCELGGHPTPGSWMLLNDDSFVAQLMLSDCIGHAGRIWNHIAGWNNQHARSRFIISKLAEMKNRYSHWMNLDPLTKLPPPPEEFPAGW